MDMSDIRVRRFKKRFPEWVFADISACVRRHNAVGAVILGCCAIDYISRFYSGDPAHHMNKAKYTVFLSRYFSPEYDVEDFYRFVRCGLIHGYYMGRRYIVVGSPARWAQSLHMKYDARHRATLINPSALYDDIRAAFTQYVDDLDSDRDLLARFLAVWSSSPFERPQLSSDWNKFKHLVDGDVPS